MLLAGAVEVAATSEIEPHMGAALGPAKEDQIGWAQQLLLISADRHLLAEPFLLIGVTGNPDPFAGKSSLHQP